MNCMCGHGERCDVCGPWRDEIVNGVLADAASHLAEQQKKPLPAIQLGTRVRCLSCDGRRYVLDAMKDGLTWGHVRCGVCKGTGFATVEE